MRLTITAQLEAWGSLMKQGAQLRLLYAKPPQVNKLIGWELTYKGVPVRTYYSEKPFSEALLKELERTATEKDLWIKSSPYKYSA